VGGSADRGGLVAGYADEPKPLAAYAALALLFNAGVGCTLLAGRGRLPERVSARDVALMGVAAHKISRVLAKDKATSFIRAPFVRYEGDAGQGEVEETPRGRGMQRAVGELLVCPYCIGPWVAAGYTAGLLSAPRATRWVGSIFAAVTVSDFLQLAFKSASEQA
jgi:hypothetical protein